MAVSTNDISTVVHTLKSWEWPGDEARLYYSLYVVAHVTTVCYDIVLAGTKFCTIFYDIP